MNLSIHWFAGRLAAGRTETRVWRTAIFTIGCALGLFFAPVGAHAQPVMPMYSVGPQTITINSGSIWWQHPDGAIQLFPNAAGTAYIAIFGDAAPTQFIGQNLDTMAQNGISPAPVIQAEGSHSYGDPNYDGNGSWMMAAQRASDGTLVALVHCENHVFSDGVYGEWNSSGIWTSTDDGSSWTNWGEIIGSPLPPNGQFGGLNASEMIYCPQLGGWLAYSGPTPFLSTDPHGKPGTWYGYYNGSFSQLIDPSQPTPPLSPAPGLQSAGVTWGGITWNTYLKAYTYVWCIGQRICIALSSDGLHWGKASTFFTDGISGQQISYPTLVGIPPSSTQTGQDCLITYGVSPSGDYNNVKSLAANWVHFGPLTTPAAPSAVTASGSQTYDAAINVSWHGVPMAQIYNVWRAAGTGSFTKIGTVQSSSAVPNYVDRAVALGTSYRYQVTAGNFAGTSAALMTTAAVTPSVRYYTIQSIAGTSGYGLDGTGVAPGAVLPVNPLTGSTGQSWKFSHGPNYTITNQGTGLLVDVYQNSQTAGTLIDLNNANGATNQQWLVYQTGPSVNIVSTFSGFGLNVKGGRNYARAPVCQWTGLSNWLIASLPVPTNVTAGSPGYDSSVTVSWTAVSSANAYNVWRFDSANPIKFLAGVVPLSNTGTISFVDHQVTSGVTYTYVVTAFDVNAYSYYATSGFSAAASFTPSAKYYTIKNIGSGLVLDSSGIGVGETLKQQPASGADSQSWRFVTADGINYAIVNKANGYAIADFGASTTTGNAVLARPAGTQNGDSTPGWTTSQTFTISSDGFGILLRNSFNRLYLNNAAAHKSAGNPQCLRPYSGGNSESWTIY